DQDLLERFVDHQDRSAFTALVQRHGPMVRGVCWRVLHNEAEVDDAFQATFLVLLRKARSVRKQRSLGSWLYGVAFRTALRALSEQAAAAPLPTELFHLVIKAALPAAGKASAAAPMPTAAAELAKGVLRAMFLRKLIHLTIVVLAVAVTGAGVSLSSYHTLGA